MLRLSHWRAREWFALLVLNLILLAPIVVHDLRIGEGFAGLRDSAALFTLALSLAWLCTLHALVRRPWQLHAWLLPLFVVTLIDLFLVWKFESRLTTSYIAILISNSADAGEFLETWGPEVALVLTVFGLTYGACILALRNVEHRLPRALPCAAFVGVLGLYASAVAHQRGPGLSLPGAVLDVLAHDKSSPFGVVSQAYVVSELRSTFDQRRRARNRFRFAATPAQSQPQPELHVLVIGESSRPDHWSLNGYARQTNPRLAHQPRLVWFSDAVSQVALTKESVPHILTRTTLDDPPRRPVERSVMSAFKESGFTTFWLSTVQIDSFIGEVGDYAAEADHQRFFERRHDTVMLQAFDELVLERGSPRKALVVFHTQGSHFHYESRYPESFEVFPSSEAGTRKKRLVNAYDNSIRHTDHFLAELIERIERFDGIGSLLFVSDHGENLMDDERQLIGHYYNNEHDLRTAMFFFYSEEFERAFPDKARAAQRNRTRRISTANAFPSLVDAGDLRVPGTHMEWSVLRSDMHDRRRTVRSFSRSGTVDFDLMRLAEQKKKATKSKRAGRGHLVALD